MKTFEELNEAEQKAALEYCTNKIYESVIEGGLRFNDKLNEDDLQARIDKAVEKAEEMRTPWFAGEYLNDDEYVKTMLSGMAQSRAEDAIYAEPGEDVIRSIITED